MLPPQLENERFAHVVISLERLFRKALESQLEQYGVPYGHWVFLRILWKEEGLSQKELADRAGLTTPTTHTAISKMESLGTVTRIVPEKNTTRPLIYLTDHGRGLREVLEPLAIAINATAGDDISDDDLATTKATMLRMIENLSKTV